MSTVHEADVLKISGRGFKVLSSECLVSTIKRSSILALFLSLNFSDLVFAADIEEKAIKKSTHTEAITAALKLKKERDLLEARLKAMEESLSTTSSGNGEDFKEERDRLRSRVEELESRPSATIIDVAAINKQFVRLIDNAFEQGAFNSPVKKAKNGKAVTPNHANLRRQINSITIDIDPTGTDSLEVIQNARSAVIGQVLEVFQQYIEQPGADKENLSITVRNGNSPVRKIQADPRLLLQSFQRILYGVLDPNLAQLLKDCQLQVVLPDVHQPSVITPGTIAEDYIAEISENLGNRDTALFKIFNDHSTQVKSPEMLITMLREHMRQAITNTGYLTDVSIAGVRDIDVLKPKLYLAACLASARYITGRGNRVRVEDVLSGIPVETAENLRSELLKVFYGSEMLPSFTITQTQTQVHFGANPSHAQIGRDYQPVLSLTIGGASIWHFPVANNLLGFFTSCTAPNISEYPALANGAQGHSLSPMQRQITNGSAITTPPGSGSNISEEL